MRALFFGSDATPIRAEIFHAAPRPRSAAYGTFLDVCERIDALPPTDDAIVLCAVVGLIASVHVTDGIRRWRRSR